MSARLRIERAGPLTTIQDRGRAGLLVHGISASGPMDEDSYRRAGLLAGARADGAIEVTQAGLDLIVVEGSTQVGWEGGSFSVAINSEPKTWPGSALLNSGDRLTIKPGPLGNYGYLRFGGALDLPQSMGSLATSTRARLGGVEGRSLRAGDELVLVGEGVAPVVPLASGAGTGPIRFVWGIHAEQFSRDLRERFVHGSFRVTAAMDRMGVRLADLDNAFAGASILSLVSDPILPGDIQILGDGTPIVLMRDHQPTGGYPRIGTVISADLDRFAQMRPGTEVAFSPVTVEHAHRLLRSKAK
ncbi:MAG: biotin-dependent carboxyltransferase family protein [Phyllobacteriaceae bacterium]|nr:biotin-dependent carboxyltransferase family protein [Phyllobacteriaceae bacterium]